MRGDDPFCGLHARLSRPSLLSLLDRGVIRNLETSSPLSLPLLALLSEERLFNLNLVELFLAYPRLLVVGLPG